MQITIAVWMRLPRAAGIRRCDEIGFLMFENIFNVRFADTGGEQISGLPNYG